MVCWRQNYKFTMCWRQIQLSRCASHKISISECPSCIQISQTLIMHLNKGLVKNLRSRQINSGCTELIRYSDLTPGSCAGAVEQMQPVYYCAPVTTASLMSFYFELCRHPSDLGQSEGKTVFKRSARFRLRSFVYQRRCFVYISAPMFAPGRECDCMCCRISSPVGRSSHAMHYIVCTYTVTRSAYSTREKNKGEAI